MANEQDVKDFLSKVLANTYALYLKTQNYHWNVTGPRFPELHAMFETHYRDLAEAVDEIAERIRMIGFKSPGSFEEFMEMNELQKPNPLFTADEMVTDLKAGHTHLLQIFQNGLDELGKNLDHVTDGFITDRMAYHEKTSWMLGVTQ